MKRLMFTILALPLFAGCFWNTKKSNVVESTATAESNFEKTEELIGADQELSEGMTPETTGLEEDDK